MADLVLYTNPMSRGRIARWMLEEVGQPYGVEIMDYASTMKSPAYLAMNPMGKVPALKHGEVVVTETAAICAYLADAFPDAGLAPPPGDPGRGAYYRWLFFGAGPVEAAVTNKAMGFVAPPEREVMLGYGSMERVLDCLETAVAGSEYILGDTFSAIDVYLGSQIGYGLMYKSIEARPAFEAYYARIANRPALVKASALDDALMPPRPAG